MKVEEVSAAEMLRQLSKTARRKPTRAPRLDIPRAGPAERTGLTDLVSKRGWSVAATDERFRLYQLRNPAMDTGYCADEAEACRKAKAMEKHT